MSHIGKAIMSAVVVAACGCTATGYRVKLEARGLPHVDPAALASVEDVMAHFGFRETMRRRQNSTYPYDYTSGYLKIRSAEPNDDIQVDVMYSAPQKASQYIVIVIQNARRGLESPIRSEIDELGNSLYDALGRVVAPVPVSVERKAIRPPLLL